MPAQDGHAPAAVAGLGPREISWRSLCFRAPGVHEPMWLFPQIRGPILVVPIMRTIIYLGLFWGPLFMEAPMQVRVSSFGAYIFSPGQNTALGVALKAYTNVFLEDGYESTYGGCQE